MFQRFNYAIQRANLTKVILWIQRERYRARVSRKVRSRMIKIDDWSFQFHKSSYQGAFKALSLSKWEETEVNRSRYVKHGQSPQAVIDGVSALKFLPVMMSWIELSTDGIFPSLNKLALIYLSILNKDVLFIVRHMGEVFPSFDKLALIYQSILNKDVLFIVRHKVW